MSALEIWNKMELLYNENRLTIRKTLYWASLKQFFTRKPLASFYVCRSSFLQAVGKQTEGRGAPWALQWVVTGRMSPNLRKRLKTCMLSHLLTWVWHICRKMCWRFGQDFLHICCSHKPFTVGYCAGVLSKCWGHLPSNMSVIRKIFGRLSSCSASVTMLFYELLNATKTASCLFVVL